MTDPTATNTTATNIENATPLEFGKVAPEFHLKDSHGISHTRSEFRNKSGLLVLFLQPNQESKDYLTRIAADKAEYDELNVKILVVLGMDADHLSQMPADWPVLWLGDPERSVWKQWTDNAAPDGYAVYMLDMYGGVDSQRVKPTLDGLPPPNILLEWARGAQFRCSI